MLTQIAKAIIFLGERFLLQLRDDDPGTSYPNQWGFFGGEIEPGETPWQALQRELEEEIEWRPKQGSFLYRWNNPEHPCLVHHFFVVPFTGSRQQLVLHEGKALGWYTFQELQHMDLISKFVCENLIYAIENNNDLIVIENGTQTYDKKKKN